MSPGRVVHVGVTGHRTLQEPERVARQVREALPRLLAFVAGDGSGPPGLEILSALAEGADRLVAREALRLSGTTLTVVALSAAHDEPPGRESAQSRAEHAHLLARAQSVEVMPASPTPEAGYAAQGRWIADHSDVLVAVWDGAESRGEGGTAEIVAYAADRGVLLLWVRAARA